MGTTPRWRRRRPRRTVRRVLRRPRPLDRPRGALETDAKAYLPAIVAGAAVGLLLLAVLLFVDARRGRPDRTLPGSGGELILEPAVTGGTAVLGEFGACVQERLRTVAPDGDETELEMQAAQSACLPLLAPGE